MAAMYWTPRRKKTGLISLGTALLILIALAFSVNRILTPIISRKIKNAVIRGSDSLYRVNFDKISINIFKGTAELDQVKLLADTNRAPSTNQYCSGNAAKLIISGASLFAYFFHKNLEIKTVTVISPEVSFTLLKAAKATSQNNSTLYQKISPALKMIRVGKIFLQEAQLNLSDRRSALPSAYHLKELSLTAINLLIDSSSQKDTSRTLFCRDINIALRNFKGFTDNGLYHYRLKEAHFSTQSEKLVLRGISVRPLSAASFFSSSKADRFEFDLDSMVLYRLNYRTFLSDHFLHAKKLSAYQGGIGIYSNPNGKIKKTDRIITFPHYIIRKLEPHFVIDTLDISRFEVNYTELNKASAKAGTLSFKDTRARFLHISNEAAELKEFPQCTAQLTTLLMGQGKLDLNFTFNLADRTYAYNYQGRLGQIQLSAINPVLMPLALGKIKTGQLESMEFTIRGDQQKSSGTLHLLYNQLSFDLLNNDYSVKVIKTVLARTLVIKPDNPDQGSSQPRFAKIVFIRPKNYPFFKTLWETLLNGLKPCAGMGYAVKPAAAQPLTKQEEKANKKALKAAIKAKKKAEKAHQKKLQSQK